MERLGLAFGLHLFYTELGQKLGCKAIGTRDETDS